MPVADTGAKPPICAICGDPIREKHISVDHIFPRAVYKWVRQNLSEKNYLILKRRIESPENMLPVHRKCNVEKEDSLTDIEKLYCDSRQKEALRKLRIEILPELSMFQNEKESLFTGQEGKCFCCGRPLKKAQVLRRIDIKIPRIWQNGCLVCHVCNLENPDFTEVGKEKQNAEKGK